METREHPHREAWNKGKLVGQKALLKPKTSGRFAFIFRIRTQCETLLCST